MDDFEKEMGTTKETQKNKEAKNDFVRNFVNEARSYEGTNPTVTPQAPNNNSQVQDKALEGVPIEQLLAICPPDLVDNFTSPSLWIAKKALSKDLNAKEAKEIEQFFKCPESVRELKRKLWGEVIRHYFPDIGTEKINPLYALMVVELAGTAKAVQEAKNFLAEKKFVEGGKDD